MIFYLLLVVFALLMTLIAFVLTIVGLVKKKQKLWIISLAAFVVFSLLSVYSIYSYVKETINYMATDEFQMETKLKAENLGKSWGNSVSGMAQGIDSALDDDAIAKLANKGATIVGKGVNAVETGLEETTRKTTVFGDESIDNLEITIGRAEQVKDSSKYSLKLFLEFKNEFDGNLILTAYDSKGIKQDNSELNIKQKAGKANVYIFQFEHFKPGLNNYCILTKE